MVHKLPHVLDSLKPSCPHLIEKLFICTKSNVNPAYLQPIMLVIRPHVSVTEIGIVISLSCLALCINV